jgi:hypothetical protein
MQDREFPIDARFSRKELGNATVQEIQLELFRRCKASDYDVDQFISVLLAHRHLWRGAVIDRLGINKAGHQLEPFSMIKLRDIDQNFWNADTLFVLCQSRSAADELIALLPGEKFACMPSVEDDPATVDDALGGGNREEVILQFWWD